MPGRITSRQWSRSDARRRVATITGGRPLRSYRGPVHNELIDVALGPSEKVMRCESGTLLFREGELPDGVYFVRDGAVELTFAARNGNAKTLRVVDRGEILGLSAVVAQRAHECSATARNGCEVGFVERKELLRVLEERPAVWLTVLHLLSKDVNAAYDQLRSLAV